MNRTWRFTDLEFVALWSRTGDDSLPAPFVFVTDLPYEEDVQRELRSIRARWRSTADPAFDQICDDVLNPDLTVLVRGSDGKDRQNPKGSIRRLAVRREERGYLLTQLPGRTHEHSVGFIVTECDPLSLADVVVAELPKVEAGTRSSVTLPMPQESREVAGGEMEHDYGSSALWDSFEDTDQKLAEQFAQTVPAHYGYVGVRQGRSAFGPRGRLTRWLEWRDLPDDGRYVIGADPPPVAKPADAKRFVVMINVEIATVIRAIKDERMSTPGAPM
jgi:hypothetical protein